MASHQPPACRARGAVSASIPTTPGTCCVPHPVASHLWRAAASWLARRWQTRRRRASKANQSMEPAAAMTAGCCSAWTTLLLPAVSPTRVPSVSLHVTTLTPTHTPPCSPSPTQDTTRGIAGNPQPCAVESCHLDTEFGPGVWEEGFQAAGGSIHCPVGGVLPALTH